MEISPDIKYYKTIHSNIKIMTKKDFEEELDSLIEAYILENDDYEDVHLSYKTSWQGVPNEWTVDVDIVKQNN